MFLVCGYIASGKTTVADLLAEVIDVNIVRTDDIRKELFPARLNFKSIDLKNPESAKKILGWIERNDPDKIDFQQVLNPLFSLKNEMYIEIVRKYTSKIKEQKEKVYNEAFLKLDRSLKEGKNALFDATFSKKDMRKRAYQVAIKNGINNVYIIQIVCGESVVKTRLANRRSGGQATTSNAKQLEIFRLVKNEFDESRIQDDDPKNLNIKRIIYDTGSQKVAQFEKADKTTKRIRKNVIDVLSSKYKN